ncbi:MAG: hypothetical protein WD512_15010, partial [Candidatus Paceibacterota bacterium]
LCHMIKKDGELDDNVSLAEQTSKKRTNEKKKNFIEFFINDNQQKLAFCNLPKESYVFFRDISAIYNNDLGFHFFHNGLLTLIHKTTIIPLKNHYYRITFNFKKLPLVTQLRLLTWESEIKTDFSHTYNYVYNQTSKDDNTPPIIL